MFNFSCAGDPQRRLSSDWKKNFAGSGLHVHTLDKVTQRSPVRLAVLHEIANREYARCAIWKFPYRCCDAQTHRQLYLCDNAPHQAGNEARSNFHFAAVGITDLNVNTGLWIPSVELQHEQKVLTRFDSSDDFSETDDRRDNSFTIL